MTSFVTRVEDTQSAGIGNQQVVSTPDVSFASAVQQSGQALNNLVDVGGSLYAKSKAEDINTAALEQVERERKESEGDLDTTIPNGGINNLNKTINLLNKGVKTKKMSRENARLRATELVTKAIEEQPLFKDKIRQSAESLLGFNLQSEATKQFFSSFEEQASINQGPALTKAQKDVQSLMSVTPELTQSAAEEIVSRSMITSIEKQILDDKLASGNVSAEVAFRELDNYDSIDSTHRTISEALKIKREGGPINADVWRQELDKQREAYIQGVKTKFARNGINPSSSTMQSFIEETNDRYDRTYETIKNFDDSFLTTQNIDRLVAAQKYYGMQAIPFFSIAKNAIGDRFATEAFGLFKTAGGSPEKMKAFRRNNPDLASMVDLINEDPEQLRRTLEKFGAPGQVGTPQDAEVIDGMAKIFENLPAEERSSAVDAIQALGFNNKAESILARVSPTAVTAQDRKMMKTSWTNTQAGMPTIIANKMKAAGTSFSDRAGKIQISPAGYLTIGSRKMSPSGPIVVQDTGHEAYTDVQKINTFLRAAEKGWGTELGILDRKVTAKVMLDQIEKQMVEPEPAPSLELVGQELDAAITVARETGDVSGLPDNQYVDGNGNVITVRNGKVVE